MRHFSHWTILIGAILCGGGATSVAAEDSPIGFELYSWQSDHGSWRYAVLEGTTTHPAAERIRSPKKLLKNLTYLKGRLATLPPGEIVYWRKDPSRGFALPDREVIEDVRRYSEGNQLHVLLPGEPLPSPF
jgi:hypothetical protein